MLPPGPLATVGWVLGRHRSCGRRLVAEEVLEAVAAGLDAHQGQAQVDHRVAHQVIGALVGQRHQQQVAVGDDGQPLGGERCGQLVAALLHLDGEHARSAA